MGARSLRGQEGTHFTGHVSLLASFHVSQIFVAPQYEGLHTGFRVTVYQRGNIKGYTQDYKYNIHMIQLLMGLGSMHGLPDKSIP